jgi:hypothetical protein
MLIKASLKRRLLKLNEAKVEHNIEIRSQRGDLLLLLRRMKRRVYYMRIESFKLQG